MSPLPEAAARPWRGPGCHSPGGLAPASEANAHDRLRDGLRVSGTQALRARCGSESLSLAIVCNAFPAEQQARALGIWAAVSALALGAGPLVGGGLVDIDWRLIFWINLPISALGIAITLLAAPESTDPGSGRRIDAAGLLALAAGLTAVVLALVQARVWSAQAIAALGLFGLASLYGFWRIEHRSPDPIVDFSLFRNGPYFGASAAAFALVGSYWAVMFFQPQYLQDVRGCSAIGAGLRILPVTVPMIFVSPFSGRLIARFGARALMSVGMALGTLGLLALTQIGSGGSYALLLAGYLPFGIALGLVYAPMSTAAMAAMPGEKVGIASGVLAMDRVMAGTIALAVSGTVFHALLEGGSSFAAAVGGSTWVLVALCAVGTLLTWRYVRDPHRPGPDPAMAGEPPPQALHHHTHHRRFHL
jgi:MFS family permease